MKIKYENQIINQRLSNFNGKNITVELEALLQDLGGSKDLMIKSCNKAEKQAFDASNANKHQIQNTTYVGPKKEIAIIVENPETANLKQVIYDMSLAFAAYLIEEIKRKTNGQEHHALYKGRGVGYAFALHIIKGIFKWEDFYKQIVSSIPMILPDGVKKESILFTTKSFVGDRIFVRHIVNTCANFDPNHYGWNLLDIPKE